MRDCAPGIGVVGGREYNFLNFEFGIIAVRNAGGEGNRGRGRVGREGDNEERVLRCAGCEFGVCGQEGGVGLLRFEVDDGFALRVATRRGKGKREAKR